MTRIAMWSGPRNLSTAMMYSFGARSDTAVWDEPFYAAYLKETEITHPMNQDILDNWPKDPRRIIEMCVGEPPKQKEVFYQKHMTHHMLPSIDRSWINQMTNVFLIRHPARVISSYHAKREEPTLKDIGFYQQAELFHQVKDSTSTPPIVVDSADIRENPSGMLRKLCAAIDLPFQNEMLSWPKGGHPDDGPWAPHWYGSVWNSTGFSGSEGPLPKINGPLQDVLEKALPFYETLYAERLMPS